MKRKNQNLTSRKHPIPVLISAMTLLVTQNLEAQTTPGPQPNICTRACWAARAPDCGLTPMSSLTRVTVHHTAAASDWNTASLDDSKAKVRAVQNYHMDAKGWCDIGYHFVFDKLGNIFEGRLGSMSGSSGWNRGAHDACNNSSFGFTLLGYFHPPYNQSPTPEMLNSYYNAIAWRMPAGWSPYGASTYCNNTVGFIDGHRKVVSTACPGDLVYPNLITENYNGGPMRTAIAQRRTPGGTLSSYGDYDGDRKADAAVFRPSNGTWYISRTSAGAYSKAFGYSSDILAPADYDGDGKIDIAVWRPSNATWYIQGWNNNYWTAAFGANGDMPVPGDYDGDRKADAAVFRPSTGYWYFSGSTGISWNKPSFGYSTDIPVPADYDGDGKFDAAIWRPSNGNWYFSGSAGAYWEKLAYGYATDIPVPGDYNGDGKADVAVWRPSNGTWYISPSSGNAFSVPFGLNGDIPVPADYDGDGKFDAAIWRPSTATWHISKSTGGTFSVQQGQTGDYPLNLPSAIRNKYFP